jgi:Tol biopolymer transport system component
MLKELHVDDLAPWKQRFRAPIIRGTQLAKSMPTRGMAVSNKSGVYQLYTWDISTNELTQLTGDPEGKLGGLLSPDGRYVYYEADEGGNEIGHIVRVPFEGGEPQSMTPDMPPYPTGGVAVSHAGNRLAFTTAPHGGFHLYCIDLGSDSAFGPPRLLCSREHLAYSPVLSHSGEIAVMLSAEHTGMPKYSLPAFDTVSGEQIGDLFDGPETSMNAIAFSLVAGDFRLLATTNRTGVDRPLIWNPRTGDRIDLTLEELEGEVIPLDWSDDGTLLLLAQFNQAVKHLYDLQHEE